MNLISVVIENDRTEVALFEQSQLQHRFAFRTRPLTTDELVLLLTQLIKEPVGEPSVVVASVVPNVEVVWTRASEVLFGAPCVFLGPGLRTGLSLRTEHPPEIGADRIARAVAAKQEVGAPCIVVGLGEVTTIDVVNEQGAYVGGTICIGLGAAERALADGARLPRIRLQQPKQIIGRTTVAAMQSGLIVGHAGMIDRLVEEIHKEIGEATVVLTGPKASLLAPLCTTVDRVKADLVHHGIRIVFDRNQKRL